MRRVSEVVSEERPRMNSLRREVSRSAMERTAVRISEWRSVAVWRMSRSWSFVNGSIILRMSSGVRAVVAPVVSDGDVMTGPFSSALRFLGNSIASVVL